MAGLALLLNSGTRALLNTIQGTLTKRIDFVEGRMATLEKDMHSEMGEVRERMAKLEGLLEGLREAITGQRAA